MQSCRDITRLVLQAQDRALPWRERLTVRLHMLACKACPRFADQLALMRRASAQWRRYSESEPD